MLAAERRNKIAELLVSSGSIKVSDIAKTFGVSTETVRKDLNYLDKMGIAKVSHGGALSTFDFIEKPLEYRETVNLNAKNQIARKAMEFLPSKGVVFLDSGSTVLCVAKLLSLKSGYTIITNSLSAANILVGSKNTVHVTGGQINATTMSLDGFGATNLLSKVKADVAFLGTRGFQMHKGPSTVDFGDAETKRLMIANAKTTIVLADSEKAEFSALLEYTNWKNIDYLISDENMRRESIREIQKYTTVVIAKEKTSQDK